MSETFIKTMKDKIINEINSKTLTGDNLRAMIPLIASYLHPLQQQDTILEFYKMVLNQGTDELETQFCKEIRNIQFENLENNHKKKKRIVAFI